MYKNKLAINYQSGLMFFTVVDYQRWRITDGPTCCVQLKWV